MSCSPLQSTVVSEKSGVDKAIFFSSSVVDGSENKYCNAIGEPINEAFLILRRKQLKY